MTVKFTDKRTDTPSTSEDELQALESDRQARRAAVRREATRLEFEKAKIGPLESILEQSHQRVEQATAAHQARCEPLQRELEQLESEAVERVVSRREPDPEADARRADILREIAGANAELEQAVELEKAARAPTERELWHLRNEVLDPKAVLMRLTQPPFVSPALHAKTFVMQQQSNWLRARRNSAVKKLETCKYNCDGIANGTISGNLQDWQARTAAWQRELAAVEREIQDAIEESDALHQRKLDE